MQLPRAYFESSRIVREFHPQVAIGFGAYASGPILIAAHRKKVPILLVEPNAIPGFTNRILLKYAVHVAVPYEDVSGVYQGKAVLTGTPIRPLKQIRIEHSKFTIGIFGGSQGAHAINQTIVQAIPELALLRDHIHVIHQTGKADFEWIKKSYEQLAPFFETTPFIHDVAHFLNTCDLLICRSGAVTLAEITLLGKPAILVPLPTSAHGHQEQNARRLAEAGAARMILQQDFTVENLLKQIRELVSTPDVLQQMSDASRAMGKPQATANVVNLALSIAKGEKKEWKESSIKNKISQQ